MTVRSPDTSFYAREFSWIKLKVARLERFGRINLEARKFLFSAFSALNYREENPLFWDWRTSDGCTGVDERFWETSFFPPCVAHDYQCVLAARQPTRKEADKVRAYGDRMFFATNRAFGLDMFRCPGFGFRQSVIGRWVGPRCYWWLIGRWEIPEVSSGKELGD